jgi:hypothetical protein
MAGIKSNDLRLYLEEWQEDASSPLYGKTVSMSVHDVFSFQDFQTFDGPPLQAVSLAKATRRGGQGGRLEISGEDTYRGLTLPLLKAVDYLKERTAPAADANAFFPRLIVSLAVVRAPLIGAYLHNERTVMMATPWVRISRVEPSADDSRRSNVRYFDIVSSDHFAKYLNALVSDSMEASKRMRAHEEVLRSGVGLMRRGDSDPEPGPHEVLESIPADYENFPEMGTVATFQRVAPRSQFSLDSKIMERIPEDTVLELGIEWGPDSGES